ncbi:MAG: hypothetical protein FJW38_30255 [Acidobacteria bacterium]|nr:hypothetical protein [Acidobacteriota bacterium]
MLKMLGRRVEVEATITDESRSLREAAGRLSPPVIDLEALARASMPAPETVARFTRQLEEIDGNIRQSSEHAADAVRSENAIEDELRKLEAGGPVPSAEAISDARAERDRAWTRLREALVGAAEPLVGPRLLDTVASFERYGTEADRLADLAASDATRVAAHAAARRRRDEERGKISNAASRSEALAEERRFLLEKWSEVWRPTSIGPPPPADMAFWIERVSALLERREKLAKLESERDRVDVEVETIRPALEAIARDIALPAMDGLGVGLLASRIEDCLETRDRGWGDARDLETQCRVAQERIDHLCEEQKDTNEQLELWSSHWREAVGALGLPANATVDEAEAAIQVWKEVPGKLHERDNRARRVAGMQRDIDRFEEQIAPLVESIAPDLRSLPSNLAMERLNELLASALRAEARRGDATKRLAVASDALKNFRDRHQQARDRLLTLATKLPPSTDLPDLLQRLAQRDNITTALAERKGQVVVQGDGFSEDQLRSDLATFDADQADAALKTLETDDENLDGQAKIIFAEQDRELRKRQDLEQGIGAELAIQMRRNAETELLDAAREWTVLTLGSLLIGHVIERHRASQKGPLMARAGALFSMLTGGAFASIDQDFGDDDTPRLVACRSSGEQVPVAGLSEGTRDQLYLALRLAYLEDYASRAEAVPFVGDDLFTSFDEERTANGLAALAEIGTKIQPILFTHHRHVVEIARTAIGTALDVIELE